MKSRLLLEDASCSDNSFKDGKQGAVPVVKIPARKCGA